MLAMQVSGTSRQVHDGPINRVTYCRHRVTYCRPGDILYVDRVPFIHVYVCAGVMAGPAYTPPTSTSRSRCRHVPGHDLKDPDHHVLACTPRDARLLRSGASPPLHWQGA